MLLGLGFLCQVVAEEQVVECWCLMYCEDIWRVGNRQTICTSLQQAYYMQLRQSALCGSQKTCSEVVCESHVVHCLLPGVDSATCLLCSYLVHTLLTCTPQQHVVLLMVLSSLAEDQYVINDH